MLRIFIAVLFLAVVPGVLQAEIVVPTAIERAEAAKDADAKRETVLRAETAHGDARSMFDLAELLRHRPATPAKSSEVWDLYARAAEAGDWRAMNALAGRTIHNINPREDHRDLWARKARETVVQKADAGDIDAMNQMAAQSADDADSIAWYRKSAGRGDAHAMYELGIMLIRRGEGFGEEPPPAMKWMRRAADAGNVPAMLFMARQRVFGKPWPANGEEAIKWYARAADAGNADAMRAIGDIYREGKMVAVDGGMAIDWYEMAAVADGRGLARVGDMYAQGEAVPKDDALALKWYLQSASAGEAVGMYALGRKYQLGLGVAKDRDEAIRWYTIAADGACDEAERSLANLGIERLPRVFNRKLAEVYLPETNFAQVASFFQDASGVNLYIDWKSLGRAEITPELPVDLRLDDVTLSDALAEFLEMTGHAKLGYAMVDGVLIISTPDGIKSRSALHNRHLAPQADEKAGSALKQLLPDANFSGVSLNDAVDFFHDVSGMAITVDWPALKVAGVNANTPITVNLTNIRSQCALETILHAAGGSPSLDYEIRDGAVVISTAKPTSSR